MCHFSLSSSQNYIISIESNETNLAGALGELLKKDYGCCISIYNILIISPNFTLQSHFMCFRLFVMYTVLSLCSSWIVLHDAFQAFICFFSPLELAFYNQCVYLFK